MNFWRVATSAITVWRVTKRIFLLSQIEIFGVLEGLSRVGWSLKFVARLLVFIEKVLRGRRIRVPGLEMGCWLVRDRNAWIRNILIKDLLGDKGA